MRTVEVEQVRPVRTMLQGAPKRGTDPRDVSRSRNLWEPTTRVGAPADTMKAPLPVLGTLVWGGGTEGRGGGS